jgi:formate hydrogenlyase subunit 3/multisubunit Na+/H+ antiporter MnhD subunit
MRLHAIHCWHRRCSLTAPVGFLALSASVVVFLGFCCLLGLLTRSANDDTPVTWRLVAIATGLCAASAGLTTYLIW